jgi:predicted DNA-binding protein
MKKLTQQYLLKMSPELAKLLDEAFSRHLRQTGQYITKSEWIRNVMEAHCNSMLTEEK